MISQGFFFINIPFEVLVYMPNSIILIGQCGGAWGLKGSLKIISWSSPRENIFTYDKWYLSDKKASEVTTEDLSPYDVDSHSVLRSGRSLVVNFVGVDTIDDALLLQGKYIYIFKQQLESLSDEYYWHELIGMSVINEEREILGQVVDMLSTGAHDVIKVHSEGVEGKKVYLIPFVQKRFILGVSREHKQITVSWDITWST